jgi:hypothetical protein
VEVQRDKYLKLKPSIELEGITLTTATTGVANVYPARRYLRDVTVRVIAKTPLVTGDWPTRTQPHCSYGDSGRVTPCDSCSWTPQDRRAELEERRST